MDMDYNRYILCILYCTVIRTYTFMRVIMTEVPMKLQSFRNDQGSWFAFMFRFTSLKNI